MNRKTPNLLHYSAVFEPAKEGGYNVSFPAFPGCVTFGRTFEEAREKGREVLDLWLEEISEQGDPIPASKARPIVDEITIEAPKRAKVVYEGTLS